MLAHALDAEVLTGRAAPPTLVSRSGDPIARAFALVENLTTTRTPIDRALEGGETIGSLEVHHAPAMSASNLIRDAFWLSRGIGKPLVAVTSITCIVVLLSAGLIARRRRRPPARSAQSRPARAAFPRAARTGGT